VVLRRSPRPNPTIATPSTFQINPDFSERDTTGNETDEDEQFASVNTVDVHLEISRTYKAKIDGKPAGELRRAALMHRRINQKLSLGKRKLSLSTFLRCLRIFSTPEDREDILEKQLKCLKNYI
jgi:hypothetical protein